MADSISMIGSLWRGEALRGRPRASWAFDAGVTVVIVLCAVPFVFANHRVPPAAGVPVVLVGAALCLLRRVRPVPAFAAGCAVQSAVGWFWPEAAWSPLMLVLLYTVVTRCPRAVAAVCAVVLAAACVTWSWREYHDGRGWGAVAVLLIAIVVATTATGFYIATRRALLTQLQRRAEQLERERDQRERLAATRERARIAGELHDIVAHHLTVMVALADGALAQSGAAPERAADAVRTVSATGRQALADTRRLLGVLRDPDGDPGQREVPAPRAPLPGLDDLSRLVAGVRAAGLPVRLEVSPELPVPDAVTQLALYRLVQEALTNTLRHGGDGTRATVLVSHRDGAVHVDVCDDGRGGPASCGDGRGLAGMRERIAAVGGTVCAGPDAGRGWAVRARIPVGPVPATAGAP